MMHGTLFIATIVLEIMIASNFWGPHCSGTTATFDFTAALAPWLIVHICANAVIALITVASCVLLSFIVIVIYLVYKCCIDRQNEHMNL